MFTTEDFEIDPTEPTGPVTTVDVKPVIQPLKRREQKPKPAPQPVDTRPTVETLQAVTAGRDIRQVEEGALTFEPGLDFRKSPIQFQQVNRTVDRGPKVMPGETADSFRRRLQVEDAAAGLEAERQAKTPQGKAAKFVRSQPTPKRSVSSQIASGLGRMLTTDLDEIVGGAMDVAEGVAAPVVQGAATQLGNEIYGIRTLAERATGGRDSLTRSGGYDWANPANARPLQVEGFTADLLQGAGQLGVQMLQAATTGNIGSGLGSGAAQFGSVYSSLKQRGFSDDQAFATSIPEFFIGALESVGGTGNTEAVRKGVFKLAAEEGFEEIVQDSLSMANQYASLGLKPDDGVVLSLLRSGALGAILGGGAGVAVSAAQGTLGDNFQAGVDRALEPLVQAGILNRSATFYPRLSPSEHRFFAGLPIPSKSTEPKSFAPWYYSQLERAVDQKFPNKMTAQQAQAMLTDPQRGIKAEEYEWSGLKDFIADKQAKGEPVTKAELQDIIRQNAIDVKDVLLSETKPASQSTSTGPSPAILALQQQVDDVNARIQQSIVDTNAVLSQDPTGRSPESNAAIARHEALLDEAEDLRFALATRTSYETQPTFQGFSQEFYDSATTAARLNHKLRQVNERLEQLRLSDPDLTSATAQSFLASREQLRAQVKDEELRTSLLIDRNSSRINRQYTQELQSMLVRADQLERKVSDAYQAFNDILREQDRGFTNITPEDVALREAAWTEAQADLDAHYAAVEERRAQEEDSWDLPADADTGPGAPKFRGYQVMKGGTPGTYKELLLTLPKTGTDKDFYNSHFPETANILAHIRFDEQTDENGNKVLGIQEIQSDWHQQGRERGYTNVNREAIEKATKVFKDTEARYGGNQSTANFTAMLEARNALDALQYGSPDNVPNAPFKSNWHELALKRILRYAAENGYTRVVWPTGAQQIDLYEDQLRQNVDELRLVRTVGGGLKLQAFKDGQSRHLGYQAEYLTPDKLKELVGPDPARKLIADLEAKEAEMADRYQNFQAYEVSRLRGNPNVEYQVQYTDRGTRTVKSRSVIALDMDEAIKIAKAELNVDTYGLVSGSDLSIGGQVHKLLYDQKLPSLAKSLVKKFGGTTGKTKLQDITRPANPNVQFNPNAPLPRIVRVDDGLYEARDEDGYTYETQNEGYAIGETRQIVEDMIQRDRQYLAEEAGGDHVIPGLVVHYLDVPDKLRKTVLFEGQKLFSNPIFDPEAWKKLGKSVSGKKTKRQLEEERYMELMRRSFEVIDNYDSRQSSTTPETTTPSAPPAPAEPTAPPPPLPPPPPPVNKKSRPLSKKEQEYLERMNGYLKTIEEFDESKPSKPDTAASAAQLDLATVEADFRAQGYNLALTPESQAQARQQSTEIMSQLLLADPAGELFQALQRQWTDLQSALLDGEAAVAAYNSDGPTGLSQYITTFMTRENADTSLAWDDLGHVDRTAAGPLKATRQPASQSRYTYELYNPGTPGSAPALFAPPSLFQAFANSGYLGYAGGVSIPINDLPNMFKKVSPLLSTEEETQLRFYIDDLVSATKATGGSRIAILNAGDSASWLGKSLIHELFHNAQGKIGNTLSILDEPLTLAELHSEHMLQNPQVKKVLNNPDAMAILTGAQGTEQIPLNTAIMEMAAYSAGGQAQSTFGLTDSEAADFLIDYMFDLVTQYGYDALTAIEQIVPDKPIVRQALAAARQYDTLYQDAKLKRRQQIAQRRLASPTAQPFTGSGEPQMAGSGTPASSGPASSASSGSPQDGTSQPSDSSPTPDSTQLTPPTPPDPPVPSNQDLVTDDGEPLLQVVYRQPFLREVTDAFTQALLDGGIEVDPADTTPIFMQLANAVESGKLDITKAQRAMQNLGIGWQEYAAGLERSFSRFGEGLAEASRVSAFYNRLYKSDKNLAAKILPPERMLRLILKDLEASELGLTLWQRLGQLPRKMVLTALSTMSNNQVTTAMRLPLVAADAMGGLALGMIQPERFGQDTSWSGRLKASSDSIRATMEPALQVITAFNPRQLASVIKFEGHRPRWSQGREYASALQTVEAIEKFYPSVKTKIEGYSSGLYALDSGESALKLAQSLFPKVKDPRTRSKLETAFEPIFKADRFNRSLAGKVYGGVDWAYSQFLRPGQWFEYAFRRPFFIGALTKHLAREGYDFAAMLGTGTLPTHAAAAMIKDEKARNLAHAEADRFTAALEAAVDDALEFTYAYDPHPDRPGVEGQVEKAAHNMIKAVNALGPVGVAVEMFPKAIFNGLKFVYEYGPLGALIPGTRASWQFLKDPSQVKPGDLDRLGRAMTGTMFYVAAHLLRSAIGGEEWWQLKTGLDSKNEPVYLDIRRYFPFSWYFFVDDMVTRKLEGRVNDLQYSRDIKQLLLAARRSEDDNGLILSTIDWWGGDTDSESTKFSRRVGQGFGSALTVPLTPFINIRELVAQFSESENTRMDVKEAGWWGPAIDRLPWARTSLLKPAVDPLTPGPRPQNSAPAAALLLSTRFVPAGSFASRELHRLGISPYRWLRRDKDFTIDRAQYEAFGRLLTRFSDRWESDPNYARLTDAEKAAKWERLVLGGPGERGVADAAKEIGKQSNQPEMMKREKERLEGPRFQRKANEERRRRESGQAPQ